jgi:hypothetical protein
VAAPEDHLAALEEPRRSEIQIRETLPELEPDTDGGMVLRELLTDAARIGPAAAVT